MTKDYSGVVFMSGRIRDVGGKYGEIKIFLYKISSATYQEHCIPKKNL